MNYVTFTKNEFNGFLEDMLKRNTNVSYVVFDDSPEQFILKLINLKVDILFMNKDEKSVALIFDANNHQDEPFAGCHLEDNDYDFYKKKLKNPKGFVSTGIETGKMGPI